MVEFSLIIIIVLIRDAFSMCSTCSFMLRCLSIWTPNNFIESVTFNRWPYIESDVSLIAFLCEKLRRCNFSGFSFIPHLSHQVGIWFRYFCNLRLILWIPGTKAQLCLAPYHHLHHYYFGRILYDWTYSSLIPSTSIFIFLKIN